MNIFTLSHRNIVTHILSYLRYCDIKKLGVINREFCLLCRNEPLIQKFIVTQKLAVTQRTNRLLETYESSFEQACRQGDLDVINELIYRGVNPSLDNNNALRVAIEAGQIEVAELLLIDPRVDLSNCEGALDLAIENKHLTIVKRLLQEVKITSQIKNSELLIHACRRGDYELCRLLSEHVDASRRDNQALISASFQGHIEIVDLLLNYKEVNPAARDNGAIAWVNRLIEEGSDKHKIILKRLLEDERVYSSLSIDQRDQYLRQICQEHPTNEVLQISQ